MTLTTQAITRRVPTTLSLAIRGRVPTTLITLAIRGRVPTTLTTLAIRGRITTNPNNSGHLEERSYDS